MLVLSPFPGRPAVAELRKWHRMNLLLTMELLWLHKVTRFCTEGADTKSGMEKLLRDGKVSPQPRTWKVLPSQGAKV